MAPEDDPLKMALQELDELEDRVIEYFDELSGKDAQNFGLQGILGLLASYKHALANKKIAPDNVGLRNMKELINSTLRDPANTHSHKRNICQDLWNEVKEACQENPLPRADTVPEGKEERVPRGKKDTKKLKFADPVPEASWLTPIIHKIHSLDKNHRPKNENSAAEEQRYRETLSEYFQSYVKEHLDVFSDTAVNLDKEALAFRSLLQEWAESGENSLAGLQDLAERANSIGSDTSSATPAASTSGAGASASSSRTAPASVAAASDPVLRTIYNNKTSTASAASGSGVPASEKPAYVPHKPLTSGFAASSAAAASAAPSTSRPPVRTTDTPEKSPWRPPAPATAKPPPPPLVGKPASVMTSRPAASVSPAPATTPLPPSLPPTPWLRPVDLSESSGAGVGFLAPSPPSGRASSALTVEAGAAYRGIDSRPDDSFRQACGALGYQVRNNSTHYKVGEKTEGRITWQKRNDDKNELTYQGRDQNIELARFMAVMYAGKKLVIEEPQDEDTFRQLQENIAHFAPDNPPTLIRQGCPGALASPLSHRP